MDSGETLSFVDIPQLFRTIGTEDIPSWVWGTGYLPEAGPQVAVFGDELRLEAWRCTNNLTPDRYPIHTGSRLGPHIDIYGADVPAYCPEPTVDFLTFARSLRGDVPQG